MSRATPFHCQSDRILDIGACTAAVVARYPGIANQEGGTSMHEDEPTTGQKPSGSDQTVKADETAAGLLASSERTGLGRVNENLAT